MKGRCVGVSLLYYHSNFLNHFYNRKEKESLPGVLAVFYCIRKRETPQRICQKGSLTVEASIIFPLVICCFAFLLFYFQMMNVQLTVQNALEETGQSLAITAIKELEVSDEPVNHVLLAKGMLLGKLKDEPMIETYVYGGVFGISLFASEWEGDTIELRAEYVMRFPLKVFGIGDFLICQKSLFRKWNGWKSVDEKEAPPELVYVTEYGTVYHMRRNCAYLDLSIQKINASELPFQRNKNGERYQPCEICCEQERWIGSVYVTDYGTKYHGTMQCQGLKRIIYQKKISEVGGMPACGKCSK